ncbi:ubiquinol-cytochrome c reductase iron-sulfur subunit [filamentous cyanobacterium LEGE 11480]|uniref:Ubiquinol-cytochrome c reductase iron-sulfur subunit n=1 Tax=Romeriopsis navalis LEGE 11480 TaxID=2777977 RepID=A0A928VNU5_9CYAN|nr:ubiquinol-cytochrome c reductase iron-sulfur subunit [Romeriopsis navalis]MBE9032038.1 ubiquinol-cytochrome c reductase iron-sulfur subunit [Romeriopsis navalis LEGE 11480]
MNRRRLLVWLGWGSVGAWLSGIASLLTGCAPKSGEDAEGFARFVNLAVLDESGFILQDFFAKDPVIVVRDPADKNVIHAVNALCTHQQCLVNWQQDKAVFVCPCHGSTFAPDGKYLQGPAKAALQTFPTKIHEDDVWVKAD